PHGGLHAVFAAQAVHDDVEVQLAHAADDHLAGLDVFAEAESRVLVGELPQAEVQLLLLGLSLGLDGARDHRLVDVDALEDDGGLRAAHGVAGAGVAQAHGHHDAAGARALDALAAVGVHGEQAGDLVVLAGAGVLHLVARLEHARVDAQV